uniref:small monomeric GTPase n=1 Tax=Heterorhabditis bacteriophora TaxID=37862 RepID=A0A1I7WGF7_HETBA
MRPNAPLREVHVALVGMAGSGKSVSNIFFFLKFIFFKDTYCRQDSVAGQPLMVWLMDTVDDAGRDEMRWLAWADVFLVMYFFHYYYYYYLIVWHIYRYAENILERISKHEHLLCARDHKTILLGNKNDLERYRLVLTFLKADGEAMASKYKAHFAESTAAGDPRPFSQLLHTTFQVTYFIK